MDSTTEKPDVPEGGMDQETLETFFSVDEKQLRGIKGLPIVIERLTDSLRALRRENPGAFFGQPMEGLYASLEAALSDFYRAQVESTSSCGPIDPGAI